MQSHPSGSTVPEAVTLSFQLIRNTTSPDEKATGVQSYVANLPAWEILKLNTKENLRSYIAEYNPRKRNRVHDAIRTTIEQSPQRFITRNGGFAITASDITVDDNSKIATLKGASLINGAQSQGEIRRYFDELQDDDDVPADIPFFVRAEIIVDPNAVEVVETAIARNTATPVKSISQAGARGHLEELEKSIQAMLPSVEIQKSETDVGKEDTRRILQWARLLMPLDVSQNATAAERLRAYKNPEQCLTDFSDWYDRRDKDQAAKARYDFTVQIAPWAIQEYRFWETHDSWIGHRIHEITKKGGRACRRDGTGKIVWISPGLLYPILGAMSEFVLRNGGGLWALKRPSRFHPDEMIKRAVSQFRAHDSDPMYMGRSEAAYDALKIYPQTLVQVLREMENSPG